MMVGNDRSRGPTGLRRATMIRVLFLFGCVLLFGCQRCRDTIVLEGPPEMLVYSYPFRTGAWWVYANEAGSMDTLTLTAEEDGRLMRDYRGEPCYATALDSWTFTSSEPASTCSFEVDYTVTNDGSEATYLFARVSSIYSFLACGFYPDQGYSGCTLIDTVISELDLVDALRITETSPSPECLWEIIIDKNIGIVSYRSETDTFNLINHYLP